MKKCLLTFTAILGLSLLSLTGCQNGDDKKEAKKSDYDASKFILAAEPEGGLHVKAARDTVKNEDDIVIIGRIGGRIDPWAKGRAAFSIVDPALLACSDEKEDGEVCSCKTPWDYCCELDKLPSSMVLVQFMEENGKVVAHDAQDIFDIKELQTVVVQGKAQRNEEGNLIVLAHGMYVRN